MSKSLPQKPNLEHLRNEARDVLKAHDSGDASACSVLRHLRRFKTASDETLMKESVSLQEVQLALSNEYGYPGWRELSDAVGMANAGKEFAGTYATPDGGERMAKLESLLSSAPASRWSNAQMVEFFKLSTGVALREGLAALQPVVERLDDPLIKEGMGLAVNGADAEIVREIMTKMKKNLVASYERRLDVGVEAVTGLMLGESPMVIEARCRAFLSFGEGSSPA